MSLNVRKWWVSLPLYPPYEIFIYFNGLVYNAAKILENGGFRYRSTHPTKYLFISITCEII